MCQQEHLGGGVGLEELDGSAAHLRVAAAQNGPAAPRAGIPSSQLREHSCRLRGSVVPRPRYSSKLYCIATTSVGRWQVWLLFRCRHLLPGGQTNKSPLTSCAQHCPFQNSYYTHLCCSPMLGSRRCTCRSASGHSLQPAQDTRVS